MRDAGYAVVSFCLGFLTWMLILVAMILIGGCGTVAGLSGGLAADIEDGARAIKEAAKPYVDTSLSPRYTPDQPRIVYQDVPAAE